MYLLDTDTLVYLLRGNQGVVDNLSSRAADFKAFSAISYGELIYGAGKSTRPAENLAKVRRLADILPVIDVSAPMMEKFGSLKVELERGGQRLEDFDLMIAAAALSLNLRLVTNNTRHFNRIPGLSIDNWAS